MDIYNEKLPAMILRQMNEQRQNATLCDVVLEVGNETFHAHRGVLAANSDYFKILFSSEFKDKERRSYVLPETSTVISEMVIKYMYTGEIQVPYEEVEEILYLADFLCMEQLKVSCAEQLMKNLTEDNCLRTKYLADKYAMATLSKQVAAYISPRFGNLVHGGDILSMPFDFINSVLTDPTLNYVREQDLYDLVIRWVKYDLPARKEHFKDLFGKIKLKYLTGSVFETTVMQEPLVKEIMSEEDINTIRESASASSGQTGDVILCRSRNVHCIDEVHLLCYIPRCDKWITLKKPEPRCWEGMETFTCHQGNLYLVISTLEDMYGYLHQKEEKKVFWKLDCSKCKWERLPPPQHVKGYCRLVSHVNGLYLIDGRGLVEEYDVKEGDWVMCGTPAFEGCKIATWYLVPMSIDRYIYVLRVHPSGYSYVSSQCTFSLFIFDTVRRTWEKLSDIESGELGIRETERIYGYTIQPGAVLMKDELGKARIQFNLVERTWAILEQRSRIPEFVYDVWGTVQAFDRVYLVGRNQQNIPMLLMYDHELDRFKVVATPPRYLSGLMCRAFLPTYVLQSLEEK